MNETATSFLSVPERTPPESLRSLPPESFKRGTAADARPGERALLDALAAACSKLGLQPKDMLVIGGGPAKLLPLSFNAYGFHVGAGRAVAAATGASLANPELTFVAVEDAEAAVGAGLSEIVRAASRNLDATFFSLRGAGREASRAERPANLLAVSLAAGATFVARAFSGEPEHLSAILAQALQHKGFSVVDCFCPDEASSMDIRKLDDSRRDKADHAAAMALAVEGETGGALPLGVLFERLDVPTLEERHPALLARGAPVKQRLDLSEQEQTELLEELQ